MARLTSTIAIRNRLPSSEDFALIITTPAHCTSGPPQLDAYRAQQLRSRNRPSVGKQPRISDDQTRTSLQGHLERMDQVGIDRMIFSQRAAGTGHEFGDAKVGLYWTKVKNDLIKRVCELLPDRFTPAAQLPQSPGGSPQSCLEELPRCVEELGFVGCNVNPDVAGGEQRFTPAISDERWYPLWEAMTALDVPDLVHASRTVNSALHLNGSKSDPAVTFELCWSDLHDRFPRLKLIVPHGWRLHAVQLEPAPRLAHPAGKAAVRGARQERLLRHRALRPRLHGDVDPQGRVENTLYAAEPFGTAMAVDPETGRLFDTVSFVDEMHGSLRRTKEKIFVGNARELYSRAEI
jgi:4-oxalmesaconate hydratase